ncbi:MAG: patatin-like phospholipase family protein [Ignavibacteria bacterium]|nr:patatin-like phospholipase family protein [Ignavibacteria bacterium]
MNNGESKKGKLALILSGGGARGAFQAGALVELLDYFERNGKRINILAGTSVGALNGMCIAQSASLREAREEIEQQWRRLTNDDVYQIRGWELFGLFLRFATTGMDRWPSIPGPDSLFDNTPLYNRFIRNYFKPEAVWNRGTVDEFFVSLCSLNTGEAYLKSITAERDVEKAREYIMASTITTVAYPPVRTTTDDPAIPPELRNVPQLYADGGISNKTPLKPILKAGNISELYVVNTYPSYPNKSEHAIRASFPNVFSMLIRTAVELLPNLYFLRDMETVKDVNNDLREWERMKEEIMNAAPDSGTRSSLKAILEREESRLSFKQGNKHIINPVVIAPDEELPVQDTDFVQPELGRTFDLGREKAREQLKNSVEKGETGTPEIIDREA